VTGKFITFEGGEGAGKSTQARLLERSLEERGINAVLTREPGGSPGAEEIRSLLVEGEPERWTALTETLLFLAARSDHIARLIKPSLESGKWVVCDRFSASTLVYQGIARGVGVDTVNALQNAIPGMIFPDLTIILDVTPEIGLTRVGTRAEDVETRYEKFDSKFHETLRTAFRELSVSQNHNCVLVDGGREPEIVADEIWKIIRERLSL
jgi:dTMP kinase